MNTPFRNNMLVLHRWTGLTMGLVIAFLAVTAALFVLRPSLDDIVYGNLHTVPACSARLPLDQLAGIAKAAHPGAKLYAIDVNAAADSSVSVMFSDKDYVFLNPCTGAVLGTQNEYGGFFGVADWLHRFRFAKENGRLFAGWNNVGFLILLIAGGVYLWWPRKGQRFSSGFKFNVRLPGSARTINLHKVVGIYTSVVLLAISLTGVPISFVPVQNVFYTITGTKKLPPPPKSTPVDGARRLSMQQFWETSKQAFPDQEWVDIRYPVKKDDPVRFEVREEGTPHEDAKSYLYLDAYSGAVLRLQHYDTDVPLGRKIYLYCIALHSGLVGGLPYQIVLLLACLGIAVMTYSGASPYLRRKLRQPAKNTLTLQLVAKNAEAQGIVSFALADREGKPLPPFEAGAHIDVHLGPGLVRQYSLCNAPGETHRYRIAVQLAEDTRGGSLAMHALREGARVEVSAPKNHFPLAQGANRSLLFAGGIGITPILAMAEQLASTGADFELYYCTRSKERTAFLERIASSRFASRVHFHFSEGPAAQQFDPVAAIGRPAPGAHLYVCGPNGYMDAVIKTAAGLGWQDANVHREYFSGTAAHADTDTAFDLKLARSGKVVHVAKGQTALEALAACGVDVQVSCGEGTCGTCLTRVLDGEPDHRDVFLTAADRARKDSFLPCCSRAASPMLVLDL
ncbi:MAG: PepSY domain-containing protein [Telluria sp.]